MRPIRRIHLSHRRRFAALAAVAVLAACDREITRDEARADGPSLVRARSSSAELGFGVRDMNSRGDIVGMAGDQPYRWTRDGGQEPLAHPGVRAWVSGINSGGVAAGTVLMDTSGVYRAVVWGPDGQAQLLPEPLQGSTHINDAGVVAGPRRDADGRWGAFRWSAQGGMESIGYPGMGQDYGPGSSYSSDFAAFNAAGAVLMNWEEWCYDEAPHPYIDCYNFGSNYTSGAVVWGSSHTVELEALGTFELRAHDLNDSGIAVGCSGNAPVRWRADGSGEKLAQGTGCAHAVNGSGVVVGVLGGRAFRWTEAGGMQDLGSLGGYGSEALAVNEAGDVVGWARTASGAHHGFLWTAGGGMQPLAPLPGATWSTARFVNDARDVAGNSGTGAPGGYTGLRPTRWFDVVPAHPPFANAGGPYPTRISGRRYAYSAAGSTEAPGDPARYAWDMNSDGVFEGGSSAQTFTYAYPSAGTYTLRLVMRDAGEADTATATVVVEQNVAPVATIAGLPTSAAEGALVTATASVRDANQAADSTELSAMRYRWEWGDGGVSATKSATHRYADQGSYTIRLIATDAGGLADTVVRVFPVANLAPTARLGSPTYVWEGAPFTLSASALSDAPADVAAGLQVSFNCGGGFGAYGTALTQVCPARPDQGSVKVGLRVHDKDRSGIVIVRDLPVANAAPQVTAQATSPTSFAAGGSLSVSGTFTDAGAGDAPWRYRIHWGDGAYTALTPVAAGATITGSYRYARAGTYAVHITVVDKDGGWRNSAPVTVTVTP